MIIRHVRVDVLASYAVGELKPRKTAHVVSHLTECAMCGTRLRALQDMPNLLRSVQFPPMPDHLVSRISTVIAAEWTTRDASQPASEAGRRELPARSGSRSARRGSWLPRLTSPLALRVLATAGAALVVAGGGYEIAMHLGNGGAQSSFSGAQSARLPANEAGGQVTGGGPKISFMHAGHKELISAVTTATNYTSGRLGAQAAEELAVLRQQQHNGPAANTTASPAFGAGALPARTGLPSVAQLAGCVRRIAAGRLVLLVNLANYLTNPATIIVVQGKSPGLGEVFAVGRSCSATASDILARQPLPKP